MTDLNTSLHAQDRQIPSLRHDGFPCDFVWGAASASYQIEGATGVDGRGLSIWDTFCRKPGAVIQGHNGDIACDSWQRWRDDIELIKGLNLNAYRFSIAWPRIQPDGRGSPQPKALDWYKRFIASLRDAGIDPWITLYHWDLPQSLEDKGGWPARDTAFRFADYAATVFHALGSEVQHWTTLNEPWCSAFLGYGSGEHAPGRHSTAEAYRAAHHLLLGHGLAVQAFRAENSKGDIGIVINPAKPRPATARPEDIDASERASVQRTGLWLDPVFGRGYPGAHLAAQGQNMPLVDGDLCAIASPVDFIGINYYNEDIVAAVPADKEHPEGYAYAPSWEATTRMGWTISPAGLGRILQFIDQTWHPCALYITENGAACADIPDPERDGRVRDHNRIAYMKSHLAVCREIIARGLPLRGYFAWTLMDNFEWSFGYTRSFGLSRIDPTTLDRIPKDSYYFYRDVVAGTIDWNN